VNLEEKIGDLLPKVLNAKSIKGGKLEGKLQRLIKLRDRIIHMKTADREFRGGSQNSIWNVLLTDPLPETYVSAKKIVEHFLGSKTEPPYWFKNCPF
jgi:hypothetical protein